MKKLFAILLFFTLFSVVSAQDPPKEGERAGHVGLGIKGDFSGRFFNVDGKKYFYAETTGTEWLTNPATWKIGEMPPEYISREVEVYVVN